MFVLPLFLAYLHSENDCPLATLGVYPSKKILLSSRSILHSRKNVMGRWPQRPPEPVLESPDASCDDLNSPRRGRRMQDHPSPCSFFQPHFPPHPSTPQKKHPENLKTSSNFPGSRGTVLDTVAYCVPPLPGKVIKLLLSAPPKLCHCISTQHWRTFGNNPPASPYPPLEGGRRCHILSLVLRFWRACPLLEAPPLSQPFFLVYPQSRPSFRASPYGQPFLSSPCGGAPGQSCYSHCFSVSNSTQLENVLVGRHVIQLHPWKYVGKMV